ncbi:MAG: hypothetical protein ICV84_18965 [Flavisolibacter sp.]|nr:hypothetical protein [Flavisolibacter sp.]
MRLVNFGLFLFIEFMVYKILQLFAINRKEVYLLIFLALPGAFVTSILAMSEMPTYAMLSVFIYFFIKYLKASDKALKPVSYHILNGVVCGVFLGLAIIGRTQLLMLLPGLMILFFIRRKSNYASFLLPAIIASSMIYLPMFLIWKGMVPPKASFSESGVGHLNYRNLFICSVYLVLINFLVCKKSFTVFRPIVKNWKLSIASFLLLVAINIFITKYSYSNDTLIRLIGNREILNQIVAVIAILFVAYVLLILTKAGLHLLQNEDSISLFLLTSIVLAHYCIIKYEYNTGIRHISQISILIVPLLAERFMIKANHTKLYLGIFIGMSLNLLVVFNQFYGTFTLLK